MTPGLWLFMTNDGGIRKVASMPGLPSPGSRPYFLCPFLVDMTEAAALQGLAEAANSGLGLKGPLASWPRLSLEAGSGPQENRTSIVFSVLPRSSLSFHHLTFKIDTTTVFCHVC